MILLFSALVASSPKTVSASRSEVLYLRDCIEISLTNNPDIGIGHEMIRKSESGLQASYGNLLPDFSLDFYTGHSFYGPSSVQYDAQGRPVQNEGFDYENYTMRFSSDLVLWQGGSNYAGIRSAKYRKDAARADFNYTKDMLIAQVIRAYYNLVRTRMLYVVQEESRNQAEQNMERSKALLDAGSATRADVLRASVRYSNTKLQLIEAKNDMVMAREELKILMNRRDDRFFEVDTSLAIEFIEPRQTDEIDYALTNRSDLRSLKFNLQSAKSGITEARGGWWPTIGVNFSYLWNDRQLFDNPIDMFQEEYQWSVTGFVSFNIFDRMLTSTRVKSAKADCRIAEYNLEKKEMEAIREIKNLMFGMSEARERISVANETVTQASEEVRLADERYRVGAGTMLETIDAHVALTTAKSDLIRAKCDYLVAKADLARATGKMTR